MYISICLKVEFIGNLIFLNLQESMISVIVPVYKAEKYLHRCVDSILAQSYTDFELLLIDDGSPDNCGGICDEYAAKDSRVRVFHKENGGVSSARNLGLGNARGEWITFVDSDDWLEPKCLEILTQQLDADMVKCGVEASNKSFYWSVESGLFSVKQFIEKYETEFIARTSCVTLFKNGLLREYNIFFDESIRYGEDMIFNLSYLLCCENIRLVNYIGYVYFTEENGIEYSEKYKLSLDDIEVSLKKSLDLRLKIKEKRGVNVDLCNDFYLYLSMIPIIQLDDNKYLSEYYLFCKKFNPSLDIKSFYEIPYFSPIIRGVELLKSYYERKLYVSAKSLYKVLNKLSVDIHFTPKFGYKDFYVWFWLIRKNLPFSLDILMKFYFLLKRTKYN